MLPKAKEYLKADFVFAHRPTKTLHIDFEGKRCAGYVDGLEAVKQAIFMILNTERYEYIIHSWNYGIELLELIGMPIPLALPEIKRRIREALTQDSRITGVNNFEFNIKGHNVYTSFVVYTIYGTISVEKEVEI